MITHERNQDMKQKNNNIKSTITDFLSIILVLSPFLIGGLAFTLVGIFGPIVDKHHRETYIETESIVTGYKKYKSNDDDDYYKARVKYKVETEYYEGLVGSYSSPPREGNTIRVRYHPDNPKKVETTGGFSIILSYIFIPLGLILFGIGILIARFMLKSDKSHNNKKTVIEYPGSESHFTEM